MNNARKTILSQVCYTDLVYGRINKKLKANMLNDEIEKLVYEVIESERSVINKIGKNYYIEGAKVKVRITVNSHTYRVITADKILMKTTHFKSTVSQILYSF